MANDDKKGKKECRHNSAGPQSAVYGLGLIGAAVYFLQHATTVWEGILGILKAIVWPAFLVYDALRLLQY